MSAYYIFKINSCSILLLTLIYIYIYIIVNFDILIMLIFQNLFVIYYHNKNLLKIYINNKKISFMGNYNYDKKIIFYETKHR